MKNFAFSLLIGAILLIVACGKESLKSGNTSLTGKWKLVQNLMDPGDGSGKWLPVTTSTTLQLNADGTTSGTTFPTYVSYVVKDSVTLTFTLNDKSLQNYRYKISHDTMSMSPDGPIRCIEACGIRFKKQ
ncbi:MAG TPA: hypothetical protein VL442_06440 [Mucilaginibacter sp.]|nr:hypothetical protein [Mucilaginibacter sp.]